MPVIATNTAANSALVYLNRNSRDQDRSLNKISSGTRIVVASDDAAGLAVSTALKSDITSLKQARTNIQQGQSVLKVADSALSRVGDILQRMKALTAQSASASVDNTSRGFLNTEFTQLRTEINAIGNNTQFNGQALINNSFTAAVGVFTVGTTATDTIVADLSTVDVRTGGTVAGFTGINASNVNSLANASLALTAIDTAIDALSGMRATVGSYMSRFDFRGDYVSSAIDSISAAYSAIADVDLADEQTNFTSKQVLTQAAIASLAQANQMKSSLLSLVR